jgi:bifunctional UDP-N-acetylglucosamine pyrophosphorylase/glucosamine-1-phosphate N-acetyltransferase
VGQLRTIILAAGKGTRMKSETPKVLHPVCGRPILDYVVEIARKVGSLKIYVVLGHKIDQVQKVIASDLIAVEQKKLLGTADAVRCALAKMKGSSGDVLILCGDTPLLNLQVIRLLLSKHRRSTATCTFLTADVEDPASYGRIIRDDQGVAVAIREAKDAGYEELKNREINVGVYCFKASALSQALKQIKLNEKKKEFYLTDVVEIFTRKGLKVETVKTDDPSEGAGVNSREDLAVAEGVMRRKILSKFMQNGVTVSDPLTTYIDASARIGRDTVIRPFTFVEKDVQIGERCVIGPFARIRPGSRISSDVEIGNFTEVSRTKIGSKTLMKHFSFLGDAFIGSGVNIGAGTVTANYDGKNKNVTRIGDQAFIGSDSVLIAPIKIGKKATVGAGSVVTRGKNIPDQSVVVGVPARIIKKGKTR